MFATLHAGIGVKQTHSYARSLVKNTVDTGGDIETYEIARNRHYSPLLRMLLADMQS